MGKRTATVTALAIMIALAALIATVVSWLANQQKAAPAPALPAQGCRVSADGFTTDFTWEQAENASIIVGESIRRKLPARAATIALVTAYQESGMRNLNYGDRDSVGLFQQRPSQGWGSVEQIMDPWYSAGKFYDALVKVPGWQSGVINDVAQAVQRSGHPLEYGKHEKKGRAWASALTGYSPATISCVDRSGQAANAAHITDFLTRVWGGSLSVSVKGTVINVMVAAEPANWAITHLAMLRGAKAGLVAVDTAGQQWQGSGTEYAAWKSATPAPTPARIILSLRG